MNKKAPGKTLLQVSGIILILLGLGAGIGAGSSIYTSSLISSGKMAEELLEMMEQVGGSAAVDAGYMMAMGIVSAVEAVIYVVFGILGVRNCNRIEKGKFCFILGVIMLVMVVANSAYNATQGALSIFGVVFSVIFPLLYTWGGSKNMQAQS